MITGVTIGKKSMGSTISRARVLTARAEKRVPTAAKPMVARKVMVTSSKEKTATLKNRAKMGRTIASTKSMKSRLASSLPT